MNELQIKTIESVPAVIKFNKDKLISELNVTLKKYENLVFTEDNTPEIRKVLAELRKGKKAANDYRLSIKRELTAPVTEFENDVKDITKLFDDVINPINEQLNEFEEKRRNEKRKEIESIIKKTIESVGLNDKFASELVVEDTFLTKSASIRTVKESIEFKANNLLNEQKVEELNRESIEMFVKLKNSENDLNLSITAYLSQLEYKDIEDVKRTIEHDIEKELKRQKERQEEEQPNFEKEESTSNLIDDLPFDESVKEEEPIEYRVYVSPYKADEFIEFLTENDIEYYDVRELPF